jgi:flagellar export protein FliJ
MTRRQKTVSKILEIKEFNKEQLESAVRKARERLTLELEKLKVLETTYNNTIADFTVKQMSGTIPVHEVDLFSTFLQHVGGQIEHQKSIVAAHTAEVEKKQKAMVEAYKEQRLFEILHDKIVQEQRKESDQSEQKEMDYTFLSRKAKR